ncbi:MAG: hypothetical protein AB2L07_09180 [Thermoanaerobaculaceae bacterium]
MREVTTVLDALVAALKAAGEYNRNDQVAPAAVLWPDGERRWEPLLGALRKELPQVLVSRDTQIPALTGHPVARRMSPRGVV